MNLRTLSWLFGLVGFVVLIVGVALIHVPAACIVAGLALLAYARLLDRAAAALAAKKGG
ncbi:hypothetical protein QRO08_16685 [Paracidovorax citrulli]|uniref:Transmembrane protein n=1 Tax=Paracidovorax citrulli TaxID=80869 RepID=A0ABY9AL87_PARCI|nr:hypothetical protein [Paracidovorax citrulli]PVY66397.1 putative transmembrane protein PGPGW [Paracidovorax citrulli]REG69432.1 putative transmembrane protein PGPGW [Paracidovorax citrulli]RLJ93986.1 putative transmembrane protein PGPGW [Paracidovorax citrulli]WIY27911.1 hypothetical protein QRO09_12565 [Paracidovorax citrulli]WIY37143.1 hypothetical protein QRO10_12840 [Paracidovorax citrulli]